MPIVEIKSWDLNFYALIIGLKENWDFEWYLEICKISKLSLIMELLNLINKMGNYGKVWYLII